jgi:LmeA-like phospholipid-binding
MEFITIFLSGLLGLLTPAGLVVDKAAENAIRSQFVKAEQLQVRVDNAPTHQLLQGKINRVRIAGRSLQLKYQDIRVAALELETDALKLDTHSRGKRPKLKQPLQAGVRLVLTEADVNKILQSPELLARFRKLNIVSRSSTNTDSNPAYYFSNPEVKFLANNRVSLQVEIREEGNTQPLLASLETGVNIVRGRQLQLINPVAQVNEEQIPPRFIDVIVNNFNQRLNLRSLEANGLLMRILQLNMKPGELEIAAFVRVEPSSKFLNVKL